MAYIIAWFKVTVSTFTIGVFLSAEGTISHATKSGKPPSRGSNWRKELPPSLVPSWKTNIGPKTGGFQ